MSHPSGQSEPPANHLLPLRRRDAVPPAPPAPSIAEGSAIDLAAVTETEPPRVLTALKHRDFRYMWAGNFLSNIGTWMQYVAQGWLVLQLTNSAFWLGIVSFAAAAPLLVFTTMGGVIADHVDKRVMLIRTQVAMMCSAFVLALLTYADVVRVPHIVLLAFVTGVASSLAAPAHQALVPQLVPRNDLTNAVGLNSAQFNMSRVIGPTLGGFSMAAFGMTGNFLLNGVSFLAVIFALGKIRYPKQVKVASGGFWAKLMEGLRYVYHDHHMRVLVQLVSVAALLGVPYSSFVPVFARDVLHVGERGLGILMAFSGLGAFFAALTIAYLHTPRRRGLLVMISGTAFFMGVIGFSLSRVFLVSAALQFLIGYAIIIMVAIINTRMQHVAADDFRGRTMSIYATAYLGLPPIGALAAGLLSRWLSTASAIGAMAMAGLLLFWLTVGVNKDLRSLD